MAGMRGGRGGRKTAVRSIRIVWPRSIPVAYVRRYYTSLCSAVKEPKKNRMIYESQDLKGKDNRETRAFDKRRKEKEGGVQSLAVPLN